MAWCIVSVEWIDPTPENSCAVCGHYNGRVFVDVEAAPPLPAHEHCECFFMVVDVDADPLSWDDEPDFARQHYVLYAAWLLRSGGDLPPSLEPLRGEAEEHNRRRAEEENPMMGSERLRLLLFTMPGRVDRELHVIRDVAVTQAVEALGHGFVLDGVTLQQVADLGNAAAGGIKSRFTHPGLSDDGLGKFLGRVRNFRVVGDKTVGDLHLAAVAARSPHGDLRAYIEELAESDPAAFGMSMVISGVRVWQFTDGREVEATENEPPKGVTTDKPIFRVSEFHAVDAVDEPAANRDGFFSKTTNGLAASLFGQLDSLLQECGIQPAQYPALLDDFIQGRPLPERLFWFANDITEQYGFDREKARRFAVQFMTTRLSRPSGTLRPVMLTAVGPRQGEITMSEESMVTAAPSPAVTATSPNTADVWVESIRQTAVSARLSTSGLPPITRDRLAQGSYATPEALELAIAGAHEELAAVAGDGGPVDLPGRHRRSDGVGGMSTPLDRAQEHVDWFFGVENAPAPPYNFRRFDQLYVALTGDVSFTGLFDAARAQLAASPVTLPDLALNAMNKVIIQQFSRLAFWRWYEAVAVPTPNDGSLQDMAWISIGGTGNLPEVADGAAYTEGNIEDVRENDAFGKYGRYVGITRKMIKNSDIQRIQAVTKALAIDAVRTRSAKIAAIFTQASGTGPTLDQDSTVLFHANHSNVATTALGTDTTAWEAASLECFNGTEVGSAKKIATFAKYCLVPSALYFQAIKNFGYGDGYPTTYNPFAVSDRSQEDPRPVVLAVPDWTDATDWAYLADPLTFPVIHISYSADPAGRGHPMPELFSVVSETAGLMFTNDTLPIKIRDEYAYGVNGYRGIGKRNVA